MKELSKSPSIELEPINIGSSFVILKPKGVQEPIRSIILKKLSEKATIVETIKISPNRSQMHELYKSNGIDKDGTPKPYFLPMLEYYKDKQIELVLLSTNNKGTDELIRDIDTTIGFWDPNNAKPCDIRYLMQVYNLPYDLKTDYDNLIHSPSTKEDMLREISIFISNQ